MCDDVILTELWKSRHPYDVLFLELIEGYEIKESERDTNIIYYIKNNEEYIEYNKVTGFTCISYDLIWDVFESKFDINYNKIRELMKVLLETHLNLNKTKPISV